MHVEVAADGGVESSVVEYQAQSDAVLVLWPPCAVPSGIHAVVIGEADPRVTPQRDVTQPAPRHEVVVVVLEDLHRAHLRRIR